MLNALRKQAGSWVVKALLMLLVVSFAIWGIGDVFYGGSLIQDIPTEHMSDVKVVHRNKPLMQYHEIHVQPDSVLHALLGVDSVTVNSWHHQAVKRLAPGFTISARTNDGIVEAIELEGARFVLGVQFHPEKMRPEDPRWNALFARLIAEARKAQAKRVAAESNAK